MASMKLNDYSIAPASGGAAKHCVIFLHGLGDRGNGGLLDICKYWARDLPDCSFHCPDAPFAFDMAPDDFGGRQWFSLQRFDAAEMLRGVQKAAPILNDYIDEVLGRHATPPDRMVLAGFSQGTMMALHVALRRAKPFAGVLGYSGALVGPELLGAEIASRPPIMLAHGMMDDVVPFAAMGLAERTLKLAGCAVETVACPQLGHSIDDRGLTAGINFLHRVLV